MIQFVEMECPNCGGNLTKTGKNTAKCSHCGSEFLIDKDKPEPVSNEVVPKQQSGSVLAVLILMLMIPAVIVLVITHSESETQTESVNTVEIQPETYSEFFTYFAEAAYHMSPEQVTKEQLNQVTYLRINTSIESITVDYAMNNGTVNSIVMPREIGSYSQDLERFTALQSLDLCSLSLTTGDLNAFPELTELRTCNSPDELAKIVPYPEKITTLGSYSASSLVGINVFTNLENLFLHCDDDLSVISSLSALKHLKILTIEQGDSIMDFGVLQSLSNLEELSIESETLRDASFLESMTSLKKLSFTDSILLDIDAVSSLTSLTEVCLEDNYEITDYSALSNLTELETLSLELNTHRSMPSVDNWDNLTSLSIDGADSIGFLSSLPELRALSISGTSCSDYTVLSSLPNLESLKLYNIYGNIPNLDTLSNITTLKSLDISSLEVYGNVESIFGLPSLETLKISDCSFGLDFETMPENSSLKVLYMDRMHLRENIYVESSGMVMNVYYDKVNLDDKINFLNKFPNLEELYVQSNKLTGVEFTEDLPNLKKLDITDNYVTDLRPLGKLQHLETVWCGENSISQGLDLGKNVNVISDSKGKTR